MLLPQWDSFWLPDLAAAADRKKRLIPATLSAPAGVVPGEGSGQFHEPMGISVDGGGNIYVADVRNQRVQKFTSEGVFLASFGARGTGPGQFEKPVDVAVDEEGSST